MEDVPMRTSIRLARLAAFGGAIALPAVAAVACISPDSPIVRDGTGGCEELRTSADLSALKVDARVRQMMVATREVSAVVQTSKEAVATACANIAKDLGATDTWSAIEDTNEAISNPERTGACDQAAAKI